ncbi:hypothetical protein C8J38_11235 [Rhizobium sp. PP-WC-2G-219]|nr:hypothetical protein C8J38_11235 [Rhizobium sp. PP-WC-2G-219]
MTESLPGRVSTLRSRLASLDAMASNVQEASLLTGLRQDLSKEVDALDRVLSQCEILEAGGVNVTMPESLNKAREQASRLRDVFIKDPTAKSLKTGNSWINLIKALDDTASAIGNETRVAWRNYRAVVFTGEAPAVIRSRMAGTDKNQTAYQRYEAKHQAFRAAFESLPQKVSDIGQARSLASELNEIFTEFDFHVPADVKAFLDAVQEGGAPLDHLTDTVISWLKENHVFSSYRIVPRR